MATIKLVRNDTGPQIQFTITDDLDQVVDLTGATVRMHFRQAGSSSVLWSRELVVTSATAGTAVLGWIDGDLAEVGAYQGELEITFPTGVRQTVYKTVSFSVREQFA